MLYLNSLSKDSQKDLAADFKHFNINLNKTNKQKKDLGENYHGNGP